MSEHAHGEMPLSKQVTVFALAPMHAADTVGYVLQEVINHALEQLDDGRCLHDLNLAIGLSTDIDQGREAVNKVLSFQTLDTLLCFGSTSASVGLADVGMMNPKLIRMRAQTKPIRVLRLPPVRSRGWLVTENMMLAAAAVKPLLQPASTQCAMPPGSDLLVTMDERDFN